MPLPECRFCGADVTNFTKEWNYRRNYYHVKMCNCHRCGIDFKAYYDNNKFSHVIPKMPTNKMRIARYLTVHLNATEEELAEIFGLKVIVVDSILMELQKEGVVQ